MKSFNLHSITITLLFAFMMNSANSQVDCSTPTLACIGMGVKYTATTNASTAALINPGNNYGCMTNTVNPYWLYLEIIVGGNLELQICGSFGFDVDAAIWGPYNSPLEARNNCDAYPAPIACGNTPAPEDCETLIVPGTQVGDVYVILASNILNVSQFISLVYNAPGNQAQGTCVYLPVEMQAFGGQNSDNGIRLNWETASEKDNDQFVIERSSDSRTWAEIAAVPGVGNSTSVSLYDYVDGNPHLGTNYYRLRQEDVNGLRAYSEMVSVENTEMGQVQLYPNPSQSELNIHAAESFVGYTIRDMNGRQLMHEEFDRKHDHQVNLQELSNGIYYVTTHFVDSGDVTEKVQFVGSN